MSQQGCFDIIFTESLRKKERENFMNHTFMRPLAALTALTILLTGCSKSTQTVEETVQVSDLQPSISMGISDAQRQDDAIHVTLRLYAKESYFPDDLSADALQFGQDLEAAYNVEVTGIEEDGLEAVIEADLPDTGQNLAWYVCNGSASIAPEGIYSVDGNPLSEAIETTSWMLYGDNSRDLYKAENNVYTDPDNHLVYFSLDENLTGDAFKSQVYTLQEYVLFGIQSSVIQNSNLHSYKDQVDVERIVVDCTNLVSIDQEALEDLLSVNDLLFESTFKKENFVIYNLDLETILNHRNSRSEKYDALSILTLMNDEAAFVSSKDDNDQYISIDTSENIWNQVKDLSSYDVMSVYISIIRKAG
jgi:PBP1b-binding outer membrane lipoprotein LpoB